MRLSVSKPSLIAVSVVAVVAFIGGGIAHAATSSATIKVCVTSKNVVRSADAKGKCPKKTKAVAINKVGRAGQQGAQGAQGPAGAPGNPGPAAPSRVLGSDSADQLSFPAYEQISTTGPATPSSFPVVKVSFNAPRAGFYSVAAYSEISGVDWEAAPPEVGCSAYPEVPYPEGGAQVRIDGSRIGGIGSSDHSFIDSAWLEAGPHTFDIRYLKFGCEGAEFFGTYTMKNTHLQVYAD